MQIVCFEHIATDTLTELEKLAAWLDTTLHPNMQIAMARERVPRHLDQSDRRSRRKMLEESVDPKLMKRLLQLAQEYESKWQLEPF